MAFVLKRGKAVLMNLIECLLYLSHGVVKEAQEMKLGVAQIAAFQLVNRDQQGCSGFGKLHSDAEG